MTISSNLESFAGRRVVDFAPDSAPAVGDPAAVAWRLRLESYGDDRRSFDELFDQFLDTMAPDRVEALVVGTWAAEMYDVTAEVVVRRLCAEVARLPHLRSLFLGDITFEEFEISWIRQTEVTPLLLAFSGLERLRVRGADGLALRPVRHDQLVELAFETGGLPAEVARAVGGCDLPRLEHLELWLGTPDYGG
ncbi:MAG TPA: leucine-rich repeat domain-containing protein, partial [Actinomycetes bacterium]|nr:leucine-rich repeat domain-containing protein [Actinomycetes bacterium]